MLWPFPMPQTKPRLTLKSTLLLIVDALWHSYDVWNRRRWCRKHGHRMMPACVPGICSGCGDTIWNDDDDGRAR